MSDEEPQEDDRTTADPLDVKSDRFLETGGAARMRIGQEAGRGMADLPAGTRLGPYRVEELIGRGGMAGVYRAQRADGQFEQDVAVKVVERLIGGGQMIERFEQERQILASLSHPNIAGLIDGGCTDSGLPYLVMERVAGVPFDQHCDRQRLGIAARVRLVLQVVRAVEYAHSRLVVHRDIKPNNILVDTSGMPRLLDFGIAKILDDSEISGATTETQVGVRMLTPEFASPEQVLGEPVGTATDVYQLGVLLSYVVAGGGPIEFSGRSAKQVERAILDVPPTAPSGVLSRQAEDEQEGVAGNRSTRPAALRRELRGDLDAIVLKCLRKEPELRYASAAQLALDLQDFLDDRPVSARSGALAYRFGKFAQRNRVLLWSAGISAVVIVGLTLAYVRRLADEREIAQREAARARAVSSYLQGLFKNAHPSIYNGRPPTIIELITSGAESLETGLADYPEARNQLASMLGSALNSYGANGTAVDMLRPAVEGIGRPGTGPELDVFNTYAMALTQAGEYDAAIEVMGKVQEAQTQVDDNDPMPAARSAISLGLALWQKARRDEAVPLVQGAYETYADVLGPEHKETAGVLINLGLVHIGLDNEQATEHFLEAERIVLKVGTPDDAMLGYIYGNLTPIFITDEEFEKALEYSDKSLHIARIHFSETPAQVAMAVAWKGRALGDLGRPDEAIQHFRQAIEMTVEQYGKEDSNVSNYLYWLSTAHLGQGDCRAARAAHRDDFRKNLVPWLITGETLDAYEAELAACR